MEYVEVARAESERGEVVLRERRDPEHPDGPHALELRVNGVFVMDTLETSTEQQLAAAALARVDEPRSVVIGGLGLGFTLREVLADKRVERVAVVEIEGALVRWMRDGTVPHGPGFLADDRVHIVEADIRTAIAEATQGAYDLVLLDVDNGPDFLVYEDNAAVYGGPFLTQVRDALRPGGTVVVWSSSESEALRGTLREVFGDAAAIPYDVALTQPEGRTRDEQYWLYLARR
jgi:spermidine synthase